ncbi:MAG: hypothetical protein KJP21_00555 [Bacteroidia bacterium]|nr:hypothetical protein [Bacteroidia bacterium]NNJ55148.1 hypothetical protein [Bacteroidia bacterium]
MEDFLKFLPIVLWLLYKAFGSGKKKEQKPKQRPVRQKKQPKHSATLEEILKELSGESTSKPVEPTVPEQSIKEYKAAKEESRSNEKIELVDHQYDFMPEYEHHADTGPDLNEIREEIELEKLSYVEEDYRVDINLRDAIVYETILNRPKF